MTAMNRIPSGYKQTEVGVIPEDWSVANAEQVCELVVDCKNRTPPVVEGGEFAVVRTPNVRSGKFVREELRFTDEKSFIEWTARAVPQVGDVLITREAPLGEVCLVPSDLSVCLGQRMMLYRPNSEKTNTAFLLYALMSTTVQGNLLRKIGGSTVGHAKVDDIRNLQIPLPPTISEQRAIATALSDVDALLAAQDKLIAKKRDIKQAAMQQLLTGKQRLPGFSGAWEVKRLGKLLHFQVGCPFSSDYFNQKADGIRLVKNRDLKSDDQTFYYSGNFDDAFLVQNGDVLIGMDGDFLPCLWSKGEALLNQRVGRVVPHSGLDASFAYYHFMEPLKAIEYATSCTTVKHLSHSDIENIELSMPELEEQTAIAAVLSDMDADLAALEQQRDKTRALKQGMMQVLLTGKIRLTAN
jgi:type I restriction enzyme S subunit